MEILGNLEPRSVFHFFEELTRIPHESGNTAAVSRWVADFAKVRNLPCRQDALGNVVIWKSASPGYENHPTVMLQGHMDMVCVKDLGVTHDFARDPLELYIEDGWIKARGTTLGGDDGAAVAMMLALLDDNALVHPPIEAVFTVDEEVGLLGAAALDCSDLKGRLLINLDSEAEGVLTVGCAGGVRCDLTLSLPVENAAGRVCTVSVSGLPGGHSGAEIHQNYANANRLLAQCLAELPDLRLISLYGGEQDNAIPNCAEAEIFLPADQVDAAAKRLDEAFRRANADYNTPACADPGCGFSWASPARLPRALSLADSRRVLDLILSAPNGVQAMEPDLPGQVRTSLNLGVLRLKEGALSVTWSVRSSASAEKETLVARLKSLAEQNGGAFDRRGDYPAWEYRRDSLLRDTMVRVFQERYGREPVVETIHAGLECGLLAQKLPGLDAVSVGPDMADIHSPRERLSISSVQRTWEYLLAILNRL